ncbi:tRNA1(Val) (adenine(37)-N6)-methyltransferase [Paracraurococcus lichenis]|uniref:Methyltransferase domain-containing protein n=1 Tax=Paracraurococcus lichenis TaxID=3064888 RepID=A0ABT9E821_9PROT|nr:methyltransferase domain-containing protein [Paracraurococcus sp. LOR1-02]MDO9712274.1 methyltransferase domain-containing protein [Paracraurococcus sp. LOR1-02]
MSDPPEALAAPTEDRLLGGRVRLRQPRRGLRAGLDAVLLAAGVPAKPGQRVLEAGCGSGAGFLCLAARVPGLTILAVERDPGLAALARENAALNGLEGQVEVIEADVRDLALARRLPPVDHAFANPPYWPGGTAPPEALRRAATHEEASLLDWARFLAAPLLRRGSLGLILPAARLEAGMAALAGAGCGGVRLLPVWPRAGLAAKRVLLQGRREGRGPARVEPGLVVHEGEGFSAAAEAVLRDAAALPG